jgi:hypothetical protein
MQHIYNGKTRVWLFECVCVLLYIHDNYYFYSRGPPDIFITRVYTHIHEHEHVYYIHVVQVHTSTIYPVVTMCKKVYVVPIRMVCVCVQHEVLVFLVFFSF